MGPYLIYLFTFSVFLPITFFERSLSFYFGLIFVFYKILKIIANKEKLLPVNKIFFLIIILYLYTLIISIFHKISILNNYYIAFGLNIFISYLIFHEIEKKKKLVKNILLFFSLTSLLFSLFIIFNFNTEINEQKRVTVLNLNHNELGWLMAIGLTYFLSLFFLLRTNLSWKTYEKYFVAFLILACLFILNSIILIGSRAPIFLTFLILIGSLIYCCFKKINFIQNIFFLITNLIFLFYKIYTYQPIHERLIYEPILRIKSFFQSEKETALLKDRIFGERDLNESIDVRIAYIKDGLYLFNENFIFGIGYNHTNYHNTFLNLTLEAGFIALCILIVIMIVILRKLLLINLKKNIGDIFFVNTLFLYIVLIPLFKDVITSKFWWLIFAIFVSKIYNDKNTV
jgi:O-antigen ligase